MLESSIPRVDNPTKLRANVVEKMTGNWKYNSLTGSRNPVCPDAQHQVPVGRIKTQFWRPSPLESLGRFSKDRGEGGGQSPLHVKKVLRVIGHTGKGSSLRAFIRNAFITTPFTLVTM